MRPCTLCYTHIERRGFLDHDVELLAKETRTAIDLSHESALFASRNVGLQFSQQRLRPMFNVHGRTGTLLSQISRSHERIRLSIAAHRSRQTQAIVFAVCSNDVLSRGSLLSYHSRGLSDDEENGRPRDRGSIAGRYQIGPAATTATTTVERWFKSDLEREEGRLIFRLDCSPVAIIGTTLNAGYTDVFAPRTEEERRAFVGEN